MQKNIILNGNLQFPGMLIGNFLILLHVVFFLFSNKKCKVVKPTKLGLGLYWLSLMLGFNCREFLENLQPYRNSSPEV